MLKAAIEKIYDLAQPKIQEVNGRTFLLTPEGYQEIQGEVAVPKVLELDSLEAMVKLVKTEALQRWDTPVYITIPSHVAVRCFAQPRPYEDRYTRPAYYHANATDIPGWGDSVSLSFEEAMIALRTRFQETPDTAYALKLLSEITTGAKITLNDNGIATSVVTKKGIDLQTNEAIRPIVTLKPYRTFQEVEQPASQFLIRITERGILFTEADGGMWKLEARKTVKAYFENALEAEIEAGQVVVAL